VRDTARGARVEALQELVAPVLVDGDLVGDHDPVPAVAREELGVDVGAVVDHDHDLRVGVHVGSRAGDELVELDAADVGHRRRVVPGLPERAS
jgi:hypothetical protein